MGNVYIVYDLDALPKNLTNNFKFQISLFRAISVVKCSGKEKWRCSGYGITFDTEGSWSFNYDFARKVIYFGIDNSLSSHADKRKNNILVLGEGPTYGINGSFGSPEKQFSTNIS